MRRLYIHIGAHKAGSTSLQLALSENCYRLRTNGVRYVNTGRQNLIGPHHYYTSAARVYPEKSSVSLFLKLAQEIEEAKESNFVISAEGLESLSKRNALSPFVALKNDQNLELVVVFLVRHHADQLNSAYVQVIRELQYGDSFNEFLRARIGVYNRRYRHCVELWSSIANRMVVMEFSAARVEAFFKSEFDVDLKLGHANRAINPLAIEALRRFRAKRVRSQSSHVALRQTNQHVIDAICARAAEFDSIYGRFWGFNAEQYSRVAIRCKADAQFLKQSFGVEFQDSANRPQSIIIPPYTEADRKLLEYVLNG